jgi:hypothetical protein
VPVESARLPSANPAEARGSWTSTVLKELLILMTHNLPVLSTFQPYSGFSLSGWIKAPKSTGHATKNVRESSGVVSYRARPDRPSHDSNLCCGIHESCMGCDDSCEPARSRSLSYLIFQAVWHCGCSPGHSAGSLGHSSDRIASPGLYH